MRPAELRSAQETGALPKETRTDGHGRCSPEFSAVDYKQWAATAFLSRGSGLWSHQETPSDFWVLGSSCCNLPSSGQSAHCSAPGWPHTLAVLAGWWDLPTPGSFTPLHPCTPIPGSEKAPATSRGRKIKTETSTPSGYFQSHEECQNPTDKEARFRGSCHRQGDAS